MIVDGAACVGGRRASDDLDEAATWLKRDGDFVWLGLHMPDRTDLELVAASSDVDGDEARLARAPAPASSWCWPAWPWWPPSSTAASAAAAGSDHATRGRTCALGWGARGEQVAEAVGPVPAPIWVRRSVARGCRASAPCRSR